MSTPALTALLCETWWSERPGLLRYASRLGLSAAEGEDLASDALERALVALTAPPAHAGAWFRLTMRHALIDGLRRAARHRAAVEVLSRGASMQAATWPAEAEEHPAQRLARALSVLNRTQVDVLSLRAAGLSHAQVGRRLGHSERWSVDMTSRARAVVRREAPQVPGD